MADRTRSVVSRINSGSRTVSTMFSVVLNVLNQRFRVIGVIGTQFLSAVRTAGVAARIFASREQANESG